METTLNMHPAIYNKIHDTARAQGVSPSYVVITLMKKVMAGTDDPCRMGSMVRYQRMRPQGEWHIFHLRLQADEYECILDLRKVLKMSVSLLVANAVEKYLSGNIKIILSDNYFIINYFMVKESIGNDICYKFHWGFPAHL